MLTNSCVLRLFTCCLALAVLLAPAVVSADEITRRVQEELRKRRLFNGDIDGQQTPELGIALKRYQERKGFPASGVVDAQTVRSMGLAEPGGEPPANIPILRSEAPAQPVAEEAQPPAPTPMSLAGDINVPPPSREELREFMQRYLAACETENVSDELAFYAPRVDYFAHGIVPKTYVRNQLVAYNETWPRRKYVMDGDVTLSKRGDNTAATALVVYELANPAQNRKADGKVNHTIVLARHAESNFEIVGIQEQRARSATPAKQSMRRRSSKKKRGSSGRRLTPLDRSLRKLFRGR